MIATSGDDLWNERYKTLRNKLTNLHYFQPLGIESCALVEKLLNDVLKSVENFETLAKRYDTNAQRLQEQQELVGCIKKDTLRVTEQNITLQNALNEEKEKNCLIQHQQNSTIQQLKTELTALKNGCKSDNNCLINNYFTDNNGSKQFNNTKEILDGDNTNHTALIDNLRRQLSVVNVELQVQEDMQINHTDQIEYYKNQLQIIEQNYSNLKNEHDQLQEMFLNKKQQFTLENETLHNENKQIQNKLCLLQEQLLSMEDITTSHTVAHPRTLSPSSSIKPEHISSETQTDLVFKTSQPSIKKNENSSQVQTPPGHSISSLQLDSDSQLQLMKEKIHALEKNLRIERSRCHRLRLNQHQLEHELDIKNKEIQHLTSLRLLQRKQNRVCHSISPKPSRSLSPNSSPSIPKVPTPSFLKLEDAQNNDAHHSEPSIALDPPKPISLNPIPSTPISVLDSVSPLPTLLNNYFSTISPLRPNTPPVKFQTNSDKVQRNQISTHLDDVSHRDDEQHVSPMSCQTINQSHVLQPETQDYYTKNGAQELETSLYATRRQLRSCQEALQAALETKHQLKQNFSLRETSVVEMTTHFQAQIHHLQQANNESQSTLNEIMKKNEQLMHEIETREEIILILETRVDLLSRRMTELASSASDARTHQEIQEKALQEMSLRCEREVCSLRSLLASATSRLEVSQTSESRLALEIARLQEEIQLLKTENNNMKNTTMQAQIILEENEDTEKMLRETISVLNKETEENQKLLQETVNTRNIELSDLQNAKDKMEVHLQTELTMSENIRKQTEVDFLNLRKEVADISAAMEASADAAAEQQALLIKLQKENELLLAKQTVQKEKKFPILETKEVVQIKLTRNDYTNNETTTQTDSLISEFETNSKEVLCDKLNQLRSSLNESQERRIWLEKKIGKQEEKLKEQRVAIEVVEQLNHLLKRRLEATGCSAASTLLLGSSTYACSSVSSNGKHQKDEQGSDNGINSKKLLTSVYPALNEEDIKTEFFSMYDIYPPKFSNSFGEFLQNNKPIIHSEEHCSLNDSCESMITPQPIRK